MRVGTPSNTTIEPMTYSIVLARAKARTFHLQERLKRTAGPVVVDVDVESVLASAEQSEMFGASK